MTRPSNTPSWLLLERYALGELPPEQRAEVDRALAEDPLARDCLASIQVDARTLPPLPAIAKPKPLLPWWRSVASWRLGLVTTAVVAVAVALLVPRAVIDNREAVSPGLQGAKGDEVVLSLVRERSGTVVSDPQRFLVDDRFKVRVTCAAPQPSVAHVAVYQDGETSFPLPPQLIACGNLVVLEGAFRIDSEASAEICVLIGDNAHAVTRMLSTHPTSHAQLDCVTLQPDVK